MTEEETDLWRVMLLVFIIFSTGTNLKLALILSLFPHVKMMIIFF